MKKLSLMGFALCLLTLPNAARAQDAAPVRVRVNGERVRFVNQQPIEQSGRVLVPLRGVLEKMGAFVEYDAETKGIVATRNETRIEMQVDGRRAQVDGRTVRLDVPAKAYSGSVLVPLRFVGEALGADVRYVSARRTVEISTSDAPIPPDPNPEPDPTPAPSTTVRGSVTTMNSDMTPRRITIRDASGVVRTIVVLDRARVEVERDGEYLPYTFMRIKRGDSVEITRNSAGRAERIRVRDGGGTDDSGTVQGNVTGIVNEPGRRVLTVRTSRSADDRNVSRAIRLTNTARIRLDAGDGVLEPATFAQIRRGDTVRVVLNPDGRAATVTILP